jgi:hypothetical protein
MSLASCDQTIGCPDAEIKWIDLLMMNGVQYQHSFPEPQDEPQNIQVGKGEPIGKTKYKMAMQPFLRKVLLCMKGYPSSLMVLAEDKVYVAEQTIMVSLLVTFIQSKTLLKIFT